MPYIRQLKINTFSTDEIQVSLLTVSSGFLLWHGPKTDPIDSEEMISTCYKTLKLDSSLSNMWFMYTISIFASSERLIRREKVIRVGLIQVQSNSERRFS